MKNLRLKYKFLLIALLSVLPTAAAAYLLAQVSSESIKFASKELDGSRYLQSLREVQELHNQHRVAYMSSLRADPNSLDNVRQQLSVALTQLDATNAKFNAQIDVDLEWGELEDRIKTLVDTAPGLDYEKADQLHNSVSEALAALSLTVGDKSNLILDPDLDSFYLMDAVLLRILPALLSKTKYQIISSEKNFFTEHTSNKFELEKTTALAQIASETVQTAIGHNTELDSVLSEANKRFIDDSMIAFDTFESVRVNSTPELLQGAYDAVERARASGYILFDLSNESLQRLLKERIAEDTSKKTTMLATILAVVCLGLFATFFVVRYISTTVDRAKTIAEAIAEDKLDNDIPKGGADEPGQLMNSLALMQEKLNTRINDERQRSVVNGRIKQALDYVSSPILVADTNAKVIYLNHSATGFFKKHEASLKSDIPNFSPDSIIGGQVDFLCQGGALLNVNKQGATELERKVGGRHLRLISTPVQDDHDNSIGSVIELSDRTEHIAVEEAVSKDVVNLVDNALSGNLTGSINAEGKPDFLVPVYKGINQMVDICNNVISGAGDLFNTLSNGDLSRTWQLDGSVDLRGDFKKLHNDANTTAMRLTDMISRLKDDANKLGENANNVVSINTKLETNAASAAQQAENVSNSVVAISSNVETIANSAEEMNSSIKEIVINTQNSSTVAAQAVQLTKAADDKVKKLTSSSQDIGVMVKVINSIAEQTNLLALNATIEAARAGEAGKGFAVVANEVKELAKETAKATEDIGEKIRNIQIDSNDAAEGIREIDSIVEQINSLQQNTSSAMEQQSATTLEISQSINAVVNGTSGISIDVRELVDGTVGTIDAVNLAIHEVQQLNDVTNGVREIVGKFTIK